ncbi:MAG: ATP-binding cassette domain-containing protein [Saprospiraceae bacterium]|nr:ATP-binding cassette domain-containing protein [Saprospiraceae bacterium]
MIEVKDLNKSFGPKEVLKNISLRFNNSKVYGIVGENGAGKTTLFRCLAGLENYDGIIDSELKPLKNHLGLLLTEPFFFTKITGEEYLQLLCNARKKSLSDLNKKNVFDLPLNQYASTYSTGMKKKLALTAILLQENQYFILDEPFNGVDIQSNMIITDIIHKLKELGKTVIISSHIFSTLNETCDEIHLLRNGEFTRKAEKKNFLSLENEMKHITIGNRIRDLELR